MLALMRTAGDVGMCSGALAVGAFASACGSAAAMHATSAFLLASAGAFFGRAAVGRRL